MFVTVRPLKRSEWRILRDLRLHALQTEPGVFFSSYAREAPLGEEEWQTRMQGPDRQVFGAFDGDRLVGITGVVPARDDPTGATAMLVMSYLLPEYRGRGLSALFYDARLKWLREHPQFERVVVSHRRSNEASRRANQRYGFVLTNAVPATWPDGGVEDEMQYELELAPAGPASP
jgi:RimJ/RimL family protein N-acetyltransferase